MVYSIEIVRDVYTLHGDLIHRAGPRAGRAGRSPRAPCPGGGRASDQGPPFGQVGTPSDQMGARSDQMGPPSDQMGALLSKVRPPLSRRGSSE